MQMADRVSSGSSAGTVAKEGILAVLPCHSLNVRSSQPSICEGAHVRKRVRATFVASSVWILGATAPRKRAAGHVCVCWCTAAAPAALAAEHLPAALRGRVQGNFRTACPSAYMEHSSVACIAEALKAGEVSRPGRLHGCTATPTSVDLIKQDQLLQAA